MRMMAKISIPVEPGNQGVTDGSLPKVIQAAAERWKPEAMYFSTFDGRRTAYFIFDLADTSDIPVFAEPFFRGLNAAVDLWPVMNVEDLQRGIGQLD